MGTIYAGAASSIGAVPPLHGNHIAPLHLAGIRPRARPRHIHVHYCPQILPSGLTGPLCNSPVSFSDTRCHHWTPWAPPAKFMYYKPQSNTFPRAMLFLSLSTSHAHQSHKLCAFSSGKRRLIAEFNYSPTPPGRPKRYGLQNTHTHHNHMPMYIQLE